MTSNAVDAARELFETHAADIHRYAARRVGRELANDVVAETFRHAIESWDGFDPSRGSARGWLFGIATNLLRRHWRAERRRLGALNRLGSRSEQVSIEMALDGVEQRLDANREVSGVLAAVTELAESDRELLMLVAWEGMAHREVAEVLDIPVGTVRSRLHRIRRELETSRGDQS